MTDRDLFAQAALQGLLAADIGTLDNSDSFYWGDGCPDAAMLADHAYQIADAMMERRKTHPSLQKPPPTPMPSGGTPVEIPSALRRPGTEGDPS